MWTGDALVIPEKALYSSQSIEDSIKALKATMEPLQSTIGVIAFLAFIIDLVVIYVVTSLIIEENKGNISLMKVFGYRKKEIGSLILSTMDVFYRSLTESVQLTLPIIIQYPYVVVGFAVVYLTYALSKALSRRKINRISMSDALKAAMD